MTAQIHDIVLYQEIDFALVGYRRPEPFNPVDYALRPVELHPACWRGFCLRYEAVDCELRLESLTIALSTNEVKPENPDAYPVLFQRRPFRDERGEYAYTELNRPLTYTGRILLGDDFINELYEPLGFHPPWKFRAVRELTFQDGKLVLDEDHSDYFAEVRDEEITRMKSRDPGWIARSFRRQY